MGHAARIERTLPVPPDRVWSALMTDELAVWYWPERFQTVAVIEAWPGGRLRMASAPMDMGVTGVFMDVVAPGVAAFTWRWDGEELETLVTATLTEADRGTRLTVIHDGFPTGDGARGHEQGWSDCLDRLVGHLQRG